MSGATRARSKERSRSRARASEGSTAALEATLEDIEAAAADLTAAWVNIGKVWAEREANVFATSSFGRWAPLSRASILRKRREHLAPDLMVETGTLRRELTRELPRAQGPHFAVFGPARAAALDYLKYHLKGQGTPQRNPAPKLAPMEHDTVVQLIRAHMGLGG